MRHTGPSRLPSSPPRRQRGAALLMAMVIVTLVTTVAASMVWQQWRAVQVEAAERSLTQSQWILKGALDWGRLILREDAKNGGADHLGEPWAVELAEARLSSFLSADKENTDDGPEAFLSGRIADVSARYNLRNLVNTEGEVDPVELAALRRLCEYATLAPSMADGIAQAFRRAKLAAAAEESPEALNKLGGADAVNGAPLAPQTLDQLVWLGLDAGTVSRLRPYVTVLPEPNTVNVNTASREVLAAVIEGLDLSRADRLVQQRARKPFNDLSEVRDVVGQGVKLEDAKISVKSDYFEVSGRLRLEDRVISQSYVIQRSGTDVTVLFENRVSGVELMPGAGRTP
ncbi:type II secretion system minor pseudopilin GspK [Aquabacterium lacunae]|nr:type II secretion system minor pseudopilin GspK [Aquabacterium lacunae]